MYMFPYINIMPVSSSGMQADPIYHKIQMFKHNIKKKKKK